MSVSHMSGPLIAYGQSGGDYNPHMGVSLFWGGAGLFDPRWGYQPGQGNGYPALGWSGENELVISQVPSALAVANIAASQVPVAATPLTLVSSTGAGITVGATVVNITNGQLVTGLLVIDGAPAVINTGQQTGGTQIYDPRTAIARAVRIVSAGDDSGGTFTVRGYDLYGQPMTEVLTGASGAPGTATGKKAFKFIASITPAGTLSGSAVTVGTTDIIGFPLRVDEWPMLTAYYGTPPAILQITAAATGFVAADATTVSGTTGDVRGTYVLQSSSDATKKVVMKILVPPYFFAPASGVYTGLFGLVNYAA